MSRIELWSRSLSRAELDLRSREARLRLEDLERLLVCHAVGRYRRRRLRAFGIIRYIRALCGRRDGGSLQGPSIKNTVLRLKIGLADTESLIWRRVEVPLR